MSKTKRIKVDFDDTSEILELVMILKDVASNLFYHSAKKKQILIDFMYYFKDFFKMANFVGANHPLVRPKIDTTAILGVTIDSAFMGDMNSRLTRSMLSEADKYNADQFIIVGRKAGEKMQFTYGKSKEIYVVSAGQNEDKYKLSIQVKDYVIQKVIAQKIGRIVAVYPFASNINVIKPKTAILFPSSEFFDEQQKKETLAEMSEKVILESEPNEVLGYLASIWLTCRLYELLMNAETSGYAAQVQQLDAATDRLKKEKLFLGMVLRKSRKADISKGLSEVFAASMVGK